MLPPITFSFFVLFWAPEYKRDMDILEAKSSKGPLRKGLKHIRKG